jgi:predicted transcriptional regulator
MEEEEPRQNYVCGFKFCAVKGYLSVLIENNLIEYSEGTQTYKITEKGNKLYQNVS